MEADAFSGARTLNTALAFYSHGELQNTRCIQLAFPVLTRTSKTQNTPLSAMTIYLLTLLWGPLPAQSQAFHQYHACVMSVLTVPPLAVTSSC